MSGQIVAQEYELTPIDKLTAHPANPRVGDVDVLVDSIAVNGFYGSVVAQRSTGHVLAGNHRLLAARQHGIESLPVIWLDVDDDAALRILLVDNRSNDLASYDDEALLAVLRELGADLGGTGYDEDALAKLIESVEPPFKPDGDIDDVRLDSLEPRLCQRCGYDVANNPDDLHDERSR
jgi:ParB-like chromosome segregation protein Spo0J